MTDVRNENRAGVRNEKYGYPKHKVTDIRNEFWWLFFFNIEKDSFIYYILSRRVQ